eukprot:1469022-Rhodomonas_salina.1
MAVSCSVFRGVGFDLYRPMCFSRGPRLLPSTLWHSVGCAVSGTGVAYGGTETAYGATRLRC